MVYYPDSCIAWHVLVFHIVLALSWYLYRMQCYSLSDMSFTLCCSNWYWCRISALPAQARLGWEALRGSTSGHHKPPWRPSSLASWWVTWPNLIKMQVPDFRVFKILNILKWSWICNNSVAVIRHRMFIPVEKTKLATLLEIIIMQDLVQAFATASIQYYHNFRLIVVFYCQSSLGTLFIHRTLTNAWDLDRHVLRMHGMFTARFAASCWHRSSPCRRDYMSSWDYYLRGSNCGWRSRTACRGLPPWVSWRK